MPVSQRFRKLFGKQSEQDDDSVLQKKGGATVSAPFPAGTLRLEGSSSSTKRVPTSPSHATSTSRTTTIPPVLDPESFDLGKNGLQQRDLHSVAQQDQEALLVNHDPARQLARASWCTDGVPSPDPSDMETQNIVATESEALKSSDLSRKLWDDAYDCIFAEEKDLVKSYLKALTRLLRTDKMKDTEDDKLSDNDSIDVSAELLDRARRQDYLQKLVINGRTRIAKLEKVSSVIGGIAGFVLKAKPMVDVVVTIPHAAPAAIPWAGVCIGLQMLSNPAKATRYNLAGIADVSNRMSWYCNLTTHLLGLRNIENYATYETILHQLEQGVVELYKAILLYQMKSVCSYYRNQGFNFFLQVWNWDDWDSALQSVTTAEHQLIDRWKVYDKAKASRLSEELVHITKRVETQLSNIGQSLQNLMASQMQMREDDENTKCLRRLVFQPRDFIALIERDKETLIPNASSWIYGDPRYAAFTNWGESNFPESRLLWIRGDAGVGKTMLLIGIIRELSKQSAKLAPNLSYFFCQSKSKIDKPFNNATAAIRSLMWMLLIQRPHLIRHVLPDFKLDEKFFDGPTAVVALPEIFKNMLSDADIGPIYFVVDALDECDVDLDILINFMSASLSLCTTVKWLVSSRPDVKVVPRLKKMLSQNIDIAKALFHLDVEVNERRIDVYIQQKLSELKDSDLGDTYTDVDLLKEISSMVKRRAEGNLLYLHLVFKDMKNVRGSYAREKIQDYPRGLSALYDHKLSKIEDMDENDLRRCTDVLLAGIYANRGLSLSELSSLVLWSGDPIEYVRKCESFLALDGEQISLVHQSARDYLEKHRSRLQYGNIKGHADIVKSSIHAMSRLTRDMFGLERHGFGEIPSDMLPPDNNALFPIAYSCEFWADHLCAAEKENIDEFKKLIQDIYLVEFLEEHFLHWLEGISLLRKLRSGIESLRKLLPAIQALSTNDRLITFLVDADRFVRSSGSIFERAPLQIYGSALVFSPIKSVIRSLLWRQRLSFVQDVNGVLDHWSPLLQTLEGHDLLVSSLAFSPDSTTLVSASQDGRTKLWDAITGAPKRTFKSDDGRAYRPVVTFSKDVTLALAPGVKGTRVQLWDTFTGTLRHTLDYQHSSDETDVSAAFSPRGNIMASASWKKLRVWDTDTRECLRVLEDCGGSVTFSPDGSTFATLWNGRIWLRNSKTYDLKHILQIDGGAINSFAYSPDPKSKTIASTSDDFGLHIWDIVTGKVKRTLHRILSLNPLLAFSSDGKALASTLGEELWFWDLTTGDHVRTLRGSVLTSIAFSPDGRTFASGSLSGAVQLWDAIDLIHKRSLGDDGILMNTRGIKLMTISPNGSMLALTSGASIRLLKLADWEFSDAPERHDADITNIVFSKDSETLLSRTLHREIRLFDPFTGTIKHKFEHIGYHSDMILAPDGTTVAVLFYSVQRGDRIRLFSLDTFTYRDMEGEARGNSRTLAFSSAGTMLAARFDNMIGLWDSSTGAKILDVTGPAKHAQHIEKIALSPDETKLAWTERRMLRLSHIATNTTETFRYRETIGLEHTAQDPSGSRITVVTFSPDGKKLATISSGPYDRCVLRFWDSATYVETDTLNLGCQIGQISFSNDCSILNTDRGLLNITHGGEDHTLYSPSPSLFVQDEWITCELNPLIWLPPQYRAIKVAISNSSVILGHQSGQITRVNFGLANEE